MKYSKWNIAEHPDNEEDVFDDNNTSY
jgi:N-acyl-L-homoserine lactone synthetase